jgi:hypothetical protein
MKNKQLSFFSSFSSFLKFSSSSVTKVVKKIAEANKKGKDAGSARYILLGNKAIQSLTRDCGENTEWSAKQLGGRSGPNFSDILPVAEKMSNEEFDRCTLVRNKFVNLVTFNTLEVPVLSREMLQKLEAYSYEYDSGVKEDTIKHFHEWYQAVSLFRFDTFLFSFFSHSFSFISFCLFLFVYFSTFSFFSFFIFNCIKTNELTFIFFKFSRRDALHRNWPTYDFHGQCNQKRW